MKIRCFTLSLIFIALLSCNPEEKETGASEHSRDTIPPLITIAGEKNQVICLHAVYTEPGAEALDEADGRLKCTAIHVAVTGTVNTGLPGTYYLYYSATDSAGNAAATVTRTVYVVENSAAFLTGVYNVVCSCTAVTKGLPDSAVTNDNYIAAVKPGARNTCFDLSLLRIGPDYVAPFTCLTGNSISLSYYDPDFHPITVESGASSGTVSAAKNAFTIETTAYQFHPTIRYRCTNVYTKP